MTDHNTSNPVVGDLDEAIVGTIDLTPTWAGVLPIYIEVLSNNMRGSKARGIAIDELRNMAMLADQRNELARSGVADVPSAISSINTLIGRIENMSDQGNVTPSAAEALVDTLVIIRGFLT